jgi:hypothetical protein
VDPGIEGDNIKLDHKKRFDWIKLAQDTIKWRALVSTLNAFGFNKK